MGSLPSSSRLPRRQDEDSPQYCVYASFSAKNTSPGVNMSNWIECYNPLTNEWHRVTSIPGLVENHIMKGFAMVIVGDFIYVIGGLLCYKEILEGHDSSDDPSEIDLEVFQSVLRYSIRDDTWFKCSPLKVPRFDFACSVNGNKIYVSGGKCKTNSVRGVSSSEVYDPALDEWKLLPNMSTSRYKCVGVTWQDTIYVVGGFAEYECEANDPQGPFSMARTSAEVYDTVNNKWEFLPRMWDLDVPPNQIVDVGGKLFSSGDCYKKWKGFIDKFDRELNMWDVVDGSSLSSPTSMLDVTSPKRPLMEQLYLTIAPIGTSLYFLAGYRMNNGETSNFRSEVHVFNTKGYGGVWTSFDPMLEDVEKELSCHCSVYKGRI